MITMMSTMRWLRLNSINMMLFLLIISKILIFFIALSWILFWGKGFMSDDGFFVVMWIRLITLTIRTIYNSWISCFLSWSRYFLPFQGWSVVGVSFVLDTMTTIINRLLVTSTTTFWPVAVILNWFWELSTIALYWRWELVTPARMPVVMSVMKWWCSSCNISW